MDQRIVDCLVDLVLRPDASRPSITVNLTVVAGVNTLAGGDEPGEIDGHPVPAELVRELAHALDLLPRTGATDADTDTATGVQAGSESDAAGDAEADVAAETTFEAEAGAVRPAVDSAQAVRTTVADEAAGARSMKSRALALTELLNLRSIAGTALTHLPTIAVVEEISGQLLALTNAAGLRSGQSLGPPVESAGYSPSVSLQAFVRARDRRCRFPG
jgi:hypothetical protein